MSAAEVVEEIVVIGITPGPFAKQDVTKFPFSIQRANSEDLQEGQHLGLAAFMNSSMASVNINSAQSNPLQPDLQFRGFTASPLLGLPQGISVYQSGVRINEPLGDTVNWDLLPESAVSSMAVISGANPVFGLNTLGGALVIDMKNGFIFEDHQVEVSTGSWGRTAGHVESGSNNGRWGYYLNLNHFEEEGWRDLSDSEASNFYGNLSWRNDERTTVDLIYQRGRSDLTGNGSLPIGLTSIQRDAIFTAPDITENDLQMMSADASHVLSDALQVSMNVFRRENVTGSFNGDASEFTTCTFEGGNQALFEEVDEVEPLLHDLGVDLNSICEGEAPSISSFEELESLIEQQTMLASLDAGDYALQNITEDLSGTGIISDEAINNISRRQQTSSGLSGQLILQKDFFSFPNQLVAGLSYFEGETDFNSVLELAQLDPVTRSTLGLGVGTYFDEAETRLFTQTRTASLYFTDTIDLTNRLSITVAGRFNRTDVELRDLSGERPELNGSHSFSRFNPSLGFTHSLNDNINIYASYSEANRVPTPVELACNEDTFNLARQYAAEAGEDPDDVDFECRLPNAFLADPPLEDVVTRSIELGVRGEVENINFQASLFRAINKDDVIFQTTGRATGLFANIDETQRLGFETALNGSTGKLAWYASYSFVQAAFGDDFTVLSPNHPNADAAGRLAVQSGDRLPGIPEQIFKVGGSYSFNQRISLGVETIYNSSQIVRGDESNDLEEVSSFTLVNLRASYETSENLTVFAKVSNVLDEKYENFGLLGEDPSEVLPDLADIRPLFLGVGAPRGTWIGVRYTF